MGKDWIRADLQDHKRAGSSFFIPINGLLGLVLLSYKSRACSTCLVPTWLGANRSRVVLGLKGVSGDISEHSS